MPGYVSIADMTVDPPVPYNAANPFPVTVIGSGGGAVTIADGADVAEGAKADAAYAGSGSASIVAINKGLYNLLAAALPAGTNLIGKVGIDQTTAGTTNLVAGSGKVTTGALATYTNGTFNPIALDIGGAVVVCSGGRNSGADAFSNAFLVNGRSTDGQACLYTIAQYVFNGASWDRQVKPNAVSRLLSSAATTNATSVKASAGNLFKIIGNNTVASKRYLKLYNKATAPTVGTDTPFMTIPILASTAFDFSFTAGMYFSLGIAYAITANAADADTAAIGAGDIECLNIGYA